MKIAFIIPVYNAANTIRRAIASIDTKYEHEIICINDGSTDESLAVLQELAKMYKELTIINQENAGAAASRNRGLASMSSDVFMFLDADDEFLPSRIDYMADYYLKNDDVDIVLGQLGRERHGEWQTIPTHTEINKFDTVNLAQCPAILQSIGPGAKMFSAKFADLRFDEDVVFCEEHTFMARAFNKASDIQLLPNIIYGYNNVEGSITEQRTHRFEDYLANAAVVRQRVMDILLLSNLRVYYSYRFDELIVSYLIQSYLANQKEITEPFINAVTMYLKTMQTTDYEGRALFRIIKVVEQGGKGWTKPIYETWRETLHYVGIGRPPYYRFKVEILPRRAKFKSKMTLKKLLKR
ncbi:glycosyltransferase family 2 protein [Staphylococcus arlettae]|uniref:glycosyltransferase family 2 protein n=1 Tax=Staphylococcus TaxID=1279 RepID=UPI0003913AE2|nr:MULTISPECIES: glycosyltransferase family 2 protein [Staphylococcus]ERF49103.1 teichoic acid biosynthesis protein [Staphylococcus sp. EGD-HP3]KAB2480861.1 glycosyltransferase family 2 protein [Staphylococcus sp. CH99b_3]MBF0736629.1 glycosyltransferase family 2 protein [Staphylococcus arlettae]MBK3719207.1 putative glycosyltransferase TagX [Staphylococcus arlettae]MCD8816427.1 glycosyltransferase family 2 protein [Staphylococcus arlettae]